MIRALICAMVVAVLAGCGGGRRYTTTQMEALQSREVEVGAGAAFDAASGALIDSGWVLDVSDSAAGILTANKREDPSVGKHALVLTLSTVLTLGQAPMVAEPTYFAIAIQVVGAGPARSVVRMRTFTNHEPEHEQKVVDELWGLMQRQALIKQHAR